MAEAALFSLASKILFTASSPAFKKAYERVCSIGDARDELDKLTRTIQTIQAVLLDAEKKQESSAAVKDWIKRIRDVLYDADDLFDEVATNDMLEKQIMKGKNKLLNKVQVSFSKLNPIVSRNSIAKKIKVIRKSLVEISSDMAQFGFVSCLREEPSRGLREGRDPGCFVDSNDVVGRDEDKKDILELLLKESDVFSVIAIVGIGGMGKTTLAQLIYNDEDVQKNFEESWFVCISDISDDKEVFGKIYQSIYGGNYCGFSVGQLQTRITESIKDKKIMLILDDVWDEDRGRWESRMKLLSKSSKGSKIVVTTRSLLVAKATGAVKPHELCGLSAEQSWDLFKRIAFAPEQERDSRRTELGREIVKKCANVPLAIRSIGSLLYTKSTIQEWEFFKDQDLSKLEKQRGDSVMNTLKLSYEHLPSNLKHCFAYCSLFPKDFEFQVQKLIYLWISQGYIKQNNEMQMVEQEGYLYFMDLFRRSFFQEAARDDFGEIIGCKMHDLVHDLAVCVAGEEVMMLSRPSSQFKNSARHVAVGCKMDNPWGVLAQPLDVNRVRSLMINIEDSGFQKSLDQQITNFKCLRTLSLENLGIKNVSSSIGELKYLRYLDLSSNKFESLPDSMTNLCNLLVLDLGYCGNLKALPDDFRKLISLRSLNIRHCIVLDSMPAGIEEMTCLQYLSDFKVGKAIKGAKMSGVEALSGLQLRGDLKIKFAYKMDDWSRDENWQLPISVQRLQIWFYPGKRIPYWPNLQLNLAYLELHHCDKVRYLPPLRCLPHLKSIMLYQLEELEYVEDDGGEESHSCVAEGSTAFFPSLESLILVDLLNLKGWQTEVRIATDPHPPFPSLSNLYILNCSGLKFCHQMQQFLSPQLETLDICYCDGLTSIRVEALPSLRYLRINACNQLKILHIAHLNALERLEMMGNCPELDLWEEVDVEKMCSVDWDSLPNLSTLLVDPIPSQEKLPDCLRHRQTLGKLNIVNMRIF